MKRVIVTLVMAVSLIGGKALAAGDENVTRRAKETLKKEFPEAAFVKWEEIENSGVYAVRFVYEDQGFVAYINAQGSMIASARLVKFENLPYRVSHIIRKMYRNDDISKIEELTMDGTLSYFFTIDNSKGMSVLRIYHDGTIHKLKEIKKKANAKM